jgi:hypothetical protein
MCEGQATPAAGAAGSEAARTEGSHVERAFRDQPFAESQRGRERFSPREFDPRVSAAEDAEVNRRTSAISHSFSFPATPPRCATKARGPGASPHQGLSLSHAALTERSLCLLPKRNPVRTGSSGAKPSDVGRPNRANRRLSSAP